MSVQKHILLAVIFTLLCTLGCTLTQVKKDKTLLEKVKVGMGKNQVQDILGKPDIFDQWEDGRFIYYYAFNTSPDEAVTRGVCEPVFFDQHKVIAVGHDMMEQVKRQQVEQKLAAENRKKEKALYEKVKKIPASQVGANYAIYEQLVQLNPDSQLYRKKRNLYKAKLEALKQKEKELNARVKSIPVHNYMENYEIYRQLVKLDPDNDLYREKRDYYKSRLDKKKKEVASDASSEQAEKLQSCWVIGYRFGQCSAKADKELPCDPRNVVEIPERCQDKEETREGIEAGKQSVQ